jgi:hypothetical protein
MERKIKWVVVFGIDILVTVALVVLLVKARRRPRPACANREAPEVMWACLPESDY